MLKSEIFEEVIHIRLSREINGQALYWTSAFLVDGLLVDTGPSYTATELREFLRAQPPKIVVNTHYHEDHIGANRLLHETFGCPIYAPRQAIPLISTRPRLYPYQELVWGYPEPSFPLPLPEKIGTDKYSFSVLPTPGHSPDHIALVEEEQGWFFTGDLIPGERMKTLRPEEKIEQIVSSIERLRVLKTERMVIFSGTGRIFPNGRQTTERLLSFLAELEERVEASYLSGQTVAEMVNTIFGGEDSKKALTQDQFSSENLIRSFIDSIEKKREKSGQGI